MSLRDNITPTELETKVKALNEKALQESSEPKIKESVSWFVTYNNPQDHDLTLPQFDPYNATPEQLLKLQEAISEKFIKAGKRKRVPEKSSILVGLEIGESGTFHAHILVCADRAITFKTLQKIYPTSHIEPAYKKYLTIRDYIFKVGKHEDRRNCLVIEPYQWGDYTITYADKQPNLYSTINEKLEKGLTPEEIYALDVRFADHANAIEKTFNSRLRQSIPTKRDVTVYYHVGASGSGKSHTLLGLEEKYGSNQVYKVAADYKHPWDEYTNQRVVMFDEFRGADDIKYSALLTYLDVYRLTLPARYTHHFAQWDEVHIATVLPPEKLYPWELNKREDSCEQLYRRIDYIVYHWKDDEGYHEFTLPFNEYENYETLIKRAEEKGGADSNSRKKETRTMKGSEMSKKPAIEVSTPSFYMEKYMRRETPSFYKTLDKVREEHDSDQCDKWLAEYFYKDTMSRTL